METRSTKTKLVVTTVAITTIPAILAIGQYVIIGLTPLFPSLDIIPLGRFFLAFAAVEFIIGYLRADSYSAYYRHANKMFDVPLPPLQQQIVKDRKAPWWLAAAIHALATIVLSLTIGF